MKKDSTPTREKMIQLNKAVVLDHLGEMVRNTVEETLNQMREARGGPALQRGEVSAKRGEDGHPRGALPEKASNEGRGRGFNPHYSRG